MKPIELTQLDLDWELAVKRLGQDIRDDFWPDPLELGDLLSNKTKTVEGLQADLAEFKPVPATCLQIPKKNLTLRTSFKLRPIDRIVYQALVDRIAPSMDSQLTGAVFSHRLGKPGSKWFFRYSIGQWKKFRAAVRESLTKRPGQYLVVTDLSQYFENVDFRALRRQLEHLAGAKISELQGPIDAVHRCLKIWSPFKTCGLPQNVDASSFLGNVLLDYVDRRMLREGYRYFRYMDDMRIVVSSEAEARIGLMRIIGFLRDLHLGVNSGKTRILGPTEVGIQEHVADDDPEIDQIEAALKTKERARIQEIVPLLFKKARLLIAEEKTDEQVFRFCVNRIIGLRRYGNLDLPEHSDITRRILGMLPLRPSESDTFCRFLSCAPLSTDDENRISRLLTSEPLCVYPWQNFHLWRLATQKRFRQTRFLGRLMNCSEVSLQTRR